MDGEAEPSLGWTTNVDQAGGSRLGDGEDCEKDDADDEDSDPGEDAGDFEPNGDERDGNLAGTNSTEEEAACAASLLYVTRLRKRRGESIGHRTEHGFHNVSPVLVPELLPDESITIIYPDGKRQDLDRLGYPVVRRWTPASGPSTRVSTGSQSRWWRCFLTAQRPRWPASIVPASFWCTGIRCPSLLLGRRW